VVLSTPGFQRSSGELLLAMVTSAAQSAGLLDWPIQDVASTGQKHPCVMQAKLFTLDECLYQGDMGQLSPANQRRHCRQLAALLADLKPA